jgi:hypothetical protein
MTAEDLEPPFPPVVLWQSAEESMYEATRSVREEEDSD